jgi:hypothetical protein
MESISLQGKTNFFEKRVSEYAVNDRVSAKQELEDLTHTSRPQSFEVLSNVSDQSQKN